MSRLRPQLFLGGIVLLLIIASAGFIMYITQGSFLSDSGCWETQRHPETNATFSSAEEYKDAVREYADQNTNYTDEQVEQLLDEKRYRVVTQDGEDVVQTRDPDLVCEEQRTVQ